MTDPATLVITIIVCVLVPLYLRNNLLISEIRERIAKIEAKINIIYDIVINGKHKR